MPWRGLIFDLDGTVADTLDTIASALNDGLARLGLPGRARTEVAGMVGEGVRVLCERALPPGLEDRVEDLVAATQEAYRRHPLRHARLYPGMADLLDHLSSAGARMGILSNKPDDLTRATVEGLGVADRFAFVLGKRDELPHKPDPAPARLVLGRLGLSPGETLYVGDTPIDVRTARAASMYAVAVTWGFRSRHELFLEDPDRIVEHPAEIARIYTGKTPAREPTLADLRRDYLADEDRRFERVLGMCDGAVSEEARAECKRFAHQMKGSGKTHGFPELSRLGAELERILERGFDVERVRELATEVREEIRRRRIGLDS